MGCNETSKNRPIGIIPDTGVKYTGPDIDALNICTGMYLDDIEAIILQKLQDYATGIGISLPDVDFSRCDFLQGFISCCAADKSLTGLMNTVFKAFCQVDTEITNINTVIADIQDYTILPGCLTVTNTKIDTVLNKLIEEYCAFVVKVTAILGDLDNPSLPPVIINEITEQVLNTVFNNIHGCLPTDISRTGTGINTILTINGTVPLGSYMFGGWDATYFDNAGVGLPAKGLCGWAACDGRNGRPDFRGFTLAMATNITGGTLDPLVDPVFNSDADIATNIGDKKGQVKHLLTSAESGSPIHTHTVNETPHRHDLSLHRATVGGGDGTLYAFSPDVPDTTKQTQYASTNITINSSGATNAVQKHENRQPTKYVNCIVRIA